MNITMLGSGSYKSSLSFRLMKIADLLGGADWSVTVIVPSADKYNDFAADPAAALRHATLVQPWQLKTHKPSMNLLPYLFTALIALVRSRPDVIYLYKPTPITVIGVIGKLLLGKPLIVDIDDLGSEVMRRQKQPLLAVWLVALSERVALRLADKVIVTSTYLADSIGATYKRKPVLIVPNGVDAEQYQVKAEGALRPHIYYFGAIGSLDLTRDLLYAIRDVYELMPDIRVSIIGNGSALAETKKLARDLGIASIVAFPGFVDMFKVQDCVRFGDIAICYQPDIPTVRAASNMKVFQYMAMASVPLVSNVGDLSAYVLNGKAGVVVEPGNPDKLKEALVAILSNPTERVAMARTARELATDTYSWATRGAAVNRFLKKGMV
jgi:glycosyltransferase involved in cell wall biosynthesis